ncbi:MICOS complex subunit Mic19p [Trichomonascus vanleenenianus]|uniref:Mic19p n=1 Tax=Trichomonascus vanleenenianus TaxID=2268995 RepID=UPI003EC969E4
MFSRMCVEIPIKFQNDRDGGHPEVKLTRRLREKKKMGARQSKEEPKVFLPKTPTEFSPSLLTKLDSSLESDYTRSQYTESYIQERVQEELRKKQAEATAALKEAVTSLKEGPSEDKENSNTLREKLVALKEQLDARPKPREHSKELIQAREELVKCFKDNKGKPLKCLDEVEAFKSQVQKY